MLIYMPQILLTGGVGQLGTLTWFNPSKPAVQFRTLCDTAVCALLIAKCTLLKTYDQPIEAFGYQQSNNVVQ